MPNYDSAQRFEKSYGVWLEKEISLLTHEIKAVTPVDWSEENRYLPPGVTSLPGYYDYNVSPFLKEIIGCLDIRSSVREVNFMKGAQIGATTGILENIIGYCMAHVSSAPIMLLTADDGLSKRRITKNLIPMINQSGLSELIQSNDPTNKRKTGKTDQLIEWRGGGSLVPFGAQNADKFRSDSIQYMLMDEVDGYPISVGVDGCPMKLAESRTKGFWLSRKICRLSTPKVKGTSKIAAEFKRGDQRYYQVPCRKCKTRQVLKFRGKNDRGETFGLVWESQGTKLKAGSVRYKCKSCGFLHKNSDKTYLLPRGRWVPTAEPIADDIRSYHLSALYAPAGMYTWDAVVTAWLEAWDDDESRPRDLARLQVFYNNELGEPFEQRGNRVTFSNISSHRRSAYKSGQIPNAHAKEFADGEVALLTCAVDVHDKHLDVAVIGWAPGKRAYLIEYLMFEGLATDLEDQKTWGALSELIENKTYSDGNGKRYRIQVTLVDAGHNNALVVGFCEQYSAAVFPILGRASADKNSQIKEFAPFKTQSGTTGYKITVDLYKDRWAPALRKSWPGFGTMPLGHFSAPIDTTDKQLRELTVEYKREKIEKVSGKRVGYEWYRPSGVRQELWDLLVYNSMGLDLIAWDLCINQKELDFVNVTGFFDICHVEQLYYTID